VSWLLLGCVGFSTGPGGPACDVDGDGFIAPDCAAHPSDVVDCDDADPDVFPGAFEACNGVDDDCSGTPDDPGDADGDGFSVCVDCNDADAAIRPTAEELCDGVDNDCSGAADEPFDADGDGFSPCGGDCDDADPTRSAGLTEQCDGADNDCDGEVDEGYDADGDGWLACRGDCDDTDPTAWWGAPEACDGVDQDCDGVADDAAGCWGCSSAGGWLVCVVDAERSEAAELCGELATGLAVVPDEATQVALVAALGSTPATWIDLSDRADEGSFAWSDGSVPTYTAWSPGQPDGDGDCVAVDPAVGGGWFDHDCDDRRPFACR